MQTTPKNTAKAPGAEVDHKQIEVLFFKEHPKVSPEQFKAFELLMEISRSHELLKIFNMLLWDYIINHDYPFELMAEEKKEELYFLSDFLIAINKK